VFGVSNEVLEMTNGTKLRQAKRFLRDLCDVRKYHVWKGDKTVYCEVCSKVRE